MYATLPLLFIIIILYENTSLFKVLNIRNWKIIRRLKEKEQFYVSFICLKEVASSSIEMKLKKWVKGKKIYSIFYEKVREICEWNDKKKLNVYMN